MDGVGVMLKKNKLVVEITTEYIKILFGNKSSIKRFALIETPAETVSDNKILKSETISEIIEGFIKENKIRTSQISYSIVGQDISIRHIEVPSLSERNLFNSVKWEAGRSLPDNGENYYTDYEIISKSKSGKSKLFKVLAISAPSEKIDRYVELAELLGLKLKAIDLSANSIARIFSVFRVSKKKENSVGVISLGIKTTEIIIVENGKLFVQREVPFGRENLVREIIRRNNLEYDEALLYLTQKFDFDHIDDTNEIDFRIRTLYDNVLDSFQKVIQFYTTGKTKKLLDGIYVSGIGSQIKGIDKYTGSFLSSNAIIIDTPKALNSSIKVPEDCNFRHFLSVYGMLLRRDN